MSTLDEHRRVAASRRRPPSLPVLREIAPASDARPALLVVMTDDKRRRAIEIGTAEDLWILDATWQSVREAAELWIEDDSVALQIWPSRDPVAIRLLNLRLDEGRPPGCGIIERADGVVVSLRTFDSYAPVIAPDDLGDDAEPFAPEYLGDLTLGLARADFESVYHRSVEARQLREVTGAASIRPPGPDGPVTKGDGDVA